MVFLGVLSTPPVFTDYLSPIVSDSNRLRLIRTDLNLSGRKKNRKSQGCPITTKKPRSSCFQFAFNLLSTVQIAREIVRYKEKSFTLKQYKRTKI